MPDPNPLEGINEDDVKAFNDMGEELAKEEAEEEELKDGDLELTPDQIADIAEKVKNGQIPDQLKPVISKLMQKRLAQERRQADVKAEREKEEAEAQSLKEQQEFKTLSEQLQKKLEQKDADLTASGQRFRRVLKSHALEKALASAEANPGRVSFLVNQVDMDAMEVDEEGNVTGASEQVKNLKKDVPELFAATEPAPDTPAPKRPVPPSPRPVTDEQDRASRDRDAKEAISRTYQNMF